MLRESRSNLVLLALLLTACQPEPDPAPSAAKRVEATTAVVEGGQSVPAGPAFAPLHVQEFALFFLPDAPDGMRGLLDRLAAETLSGVTVATSIKETEPLVLVFSELPTSEYAPPDPGALRYFGRGLSPEQEQSVQASQEVLLLRLHVGPEDGLVLHRSMMQLVGQLAESTGSLPWDEGTRELFSTAAWAERLGRWEDERPLAPDFITIHGYRDGELLRLVSLGMGKFGLPDLVLNQVASGSFESAGSLINLTAQSLLDGAEVTEVGTLHVDASSAPGDWDITAAASGRATLQLAVSTPEEGDAPNRLWEIVFPGPATSVQERQLTVFDEVFGSEDEITFVAHDEAILDASKRAKEKIAEKRELFAEGWPEQEHLLVKAPFDADDGGREWMWVEVLGWDGPMARGILQNEPYGVASLRAGARVEVDQDSLFDYIHVKADGSREGNETGKLMASQN